MSYGEKITNTKKIRIENIFPKQVEMASFVLDSKSIFFEKHCVNYIPFDLRYYILKLVKVVVERKNERID